MAKLNYRANLESKKLAHQNKLVLEDNKRIKDANERLEVDIKYARQEVNRISSALTKSEADNMLKLTHIKELKARGLWGRIIRKGE